MKNLSPFFRLIAIENCLKTGNWFSWKELGEACRVYIDNENPPNERTTRYDIELLENRFNAPIEYIEGKVKYGDTNYSFLRLGMTDYHAGILKELLTLIEQFSYLPHLEKLNEVLLTLEENSGLRADDKPKVIQLDNQMQSIGSIHLKFLYKAICNKKVLAFNYQSFSSDSEKNVLVHPYFLKEYNNRWYLMGRNENNEGKKEIFGLERIVGPIDEVDIEFKPTSFNYEKYFNTRIGISKADETYFKKVILAFTIDRGKYVLSKPIHHSQRHIYYPERPDKTVISIDVFPNKELWALILSYGEDIEVIRPSYVRKKVYKQALKFVENNKIDLD